MCEIKAKEDHPVLAICYDFDKTLSPTEMQQGYIASVGYDVEKDFWDESNGLAKKNVMDQNLAYMLTMIKKAIGKFYVTRENLQAYGKTVKLFSGVEEWFERIRQYGQEKGVIVEHYIISSGLKEIIEGTPIADAFEKIYANYFLYDENGVAEWPAQVVNYTSKTQFLFRIEKGVLDESDTRVNDSFAPDKIRVPFRNMVYIGDSDTDVPCMKLVTTYGGHAIAVYNPETGDKTKSYQMMRCGRVKYFAAADYTEGTELDTLVKAIIDNTATRETLEQRHYACKQEHIEEDRRNSERERKKKELIADLQESRSFFRTHEIIAQLTEYTSWSYYERELLYDIALENSQVYLILQDADLYQFYGAVLETETEPSEKAKQVKEKLEKPKKASGRKSKDVSK